MNPLPRAWGIEPGYHDHRGHWRATSPEAMAALLESMDTTGERPPEPTAWVVRKDEGAWLGDDVAIRLEDGGTIEVEGAMPAVTPLGYHTLVHPDGRGPP